MIAAPPREYQTISSTLVILLARAPRPGRCKTRLIPRLGSRGAARVQRQLLRDSVARVQRTGAELVVFADGPLAHPEFQRLRRAGIRLRRQVAGDLGRRMFRALRREQHPGRMLALIGTDCPQLAPDRMVDALQRLATAAVVCTPACDGGYVLIGFSRVEPAAFRGIDWGSERVMRQTRRALRTARVPLALTPPLPDLDEPADYRRERRAGRLAPY